MQNKPVDASAALMFAPATKFIIRTLLHISDGLAGLYGCIFSYFDNRWRNAFCVGSTHSAKIY